MSDTQRDPMTTFFDSLDSLLSSAQAALNEGDERRARENLNVVLGAMADLLDPAPAGEGPRLVYSRRDERVDLPVFTERRQPGE